MVLYTTFLRVQFCTQISLMSTFLKFGYKRYKFYLRSVMFRVQICTQIKIIQKYFLVHPSKMNYWKKIILIFFKIGYNFVPGIFIEVYLPIYTNVCPLRLQLQSYIQKILLVSKNVSFERT